MKSDASELEKRLRGIRERREKWTKVFDKNGQGYTITVHAKEVKLCYMDDKGEYHHHEFGTDKRQRRASVQGGNGQTLLEISPKWVRVYHSGGMWSCRRVLGKVLATFTTADDGQAKRKMKKRKQRSSISLEAHDTGALNKDEPLLCSNTPPEKLTTAAPRAHRSQFHDL